MDLSKLTPAPWFKELEPTKIILSSMTVQRIAWVFDENHTEFIALARNAFAGDPEALAWWEANRTHAAHVEAAERKDGSNAAT